MKRINSFFAFACAAVMMLGCTKENVHEEKSADVDEPAVAFTLFAGTSETRTAMNEGLNGVVWSADDQINVCHVISGDTTAFVNDTPYNSTSKTGAPFVISDVSSNKFLGTLAQALTPGSSYDWYAYYPYSSYIETPGYQSKGYLYFGSKSNASQTQTGNNSKAHLCGKDMPLYGVAKAVPADQTPSIVMNQLSSVVAVKVTNSTESSLTVNSVSFTGTENIVGTFYPDVVGEKPTFFDAQYVSETANLTVNSAEPISDGGVATYYIAIKPFDALSGDTLFVSVNGYEKEIILSKNVSFTMGKIKSINFNYDKAPEAPTSYELVSTLSDITEGEYIIVANDTDDYTMKNADAAAGNVTAVKLADAGLTIENNVLSGVSGQYAWRFSGTNTAMTIRPVNGDSYLYSTNTNNGIVVGSTEDTWAFTTTTGGFVLKEANNSRKLSLYSKSNWRGYTSTNGVQVIRLYKKADTRTVLSAPEAIVVDNVITWDAVPNADSYTISVGDKLLSGVTQTEYTFDNGSFNLATGYYSASVQAVSNNSSEFINSAFAEASGRIKVGEPTLSSPTLSDGGSTDNSLTVNWTADAKASKGYHCSISPASSDPKTVTTGSVSFDNLTPNTQYTISVYAIATDGDEPYLKSETSTITITTKDADSEFPVQISWSRSGTTNTITTGYTFDATSAKGQTGYYQDATDGLEINVTKADASALFTGTPSSITFTAKIGGGTTRDPLTNNVIVCLIDREGNPISGTETIVTTKVTSTTGSSFTVTIPSVGDVYGIRLSHVKETSYNTRLYSFTFEAKK